MKFGIKSPSIEKLQYLFNSPIKEENILMAKRVKKVLTGKKNLMLYPSVSYWVNQCYNTPDIEEKKNDWLTAVFYALDDILDGYDQETIFSWSDKVPGNLDKNPVFTYINKGETYATTIIYCYLSQKFLVTSWGCQFEYLEKKGIV